MIGFCAVLPNPNGTANYQKRVSRLVILPDYQGIGAGTRFLDAICAHYLKQGYKMYIRSAHRKLANYWGKNPCWKATARNGRTSEGKSSGIIHNAAYREKGYTSRTCYSYEYVGPEFVSKPHYKLLVDGLGEIDSKEMEHLLVDLQSKNYLTVIHNKVKNTSWLNKMCMKHGIRTELLYVKGRIPKKHRGCQKLVSLSANHPVFAKVS